MRRPIARPDEREQRVSVHARQLQLAYHLPALPRLEVTHPKPACRNPFLLAMAFFEIARQSAQQQRHGGQALLAVDDVKELATAPSLHIGRIQQHPHEMALAIIGAASAHDIVPQFLALPRVPRVHALEHRDGESNSGPSHEAEQTFLLDLHASHLPLRVDAEMLLVVLGALGVIHRFARPVGDARLVP